MNTLRALIAGALSSALVFRDKMAIVLFTPVCLATSHESELRCDPDLGYYEYCRRCKEARLLDPDQSG